METLNLPLEDLSIRDRVRFERTWRRWTRRAEGADWEQQRAAMQPEIDAAVKRLRERREGLPRVTYDLDLPILDHREAITAALSERQVLVVAGETGSGKSTQLPKFCLSAGLGVRGLIGHTQPRRIAARTIAARLAEELNVPLGRQVGYKIRFQDQTDPQTYIKLMTDGVLLAETQSDRFLDQYEVIILDEAHERSLNIDFLLGYLKQRLQQRSDLHLIITSATIDAERFGAHFADERGPAPIIEVSGRTYPVEMRYRPLVTHEGEDLDVAEGVVQAVHELARIDRGDVLVFLPTERDIRELARRLRGETFAGDGRRQTEVLPLYARLSSREQHRIFEPSDYRRIILATNVAESSLTVPNIRYVVDSGTARISRYSPRSKILRLPIEPVSRASADQRAGRCGRVAPGVCIRLFDEDDFQRRDMYTTPEIRRTNLAAVILQAKAMSLGEIEQFPFLDPPRPESIRDGYKTLFELQALTRERELTEIGRQLARMPVDPRIGRMILAGADENCLHDVLVIAAALELQDPRERPHDKQQQADERHAPFQDPESDFLSYLKLWDFYHHLKETVSRSQLQKACQRNFLSFYRLREWTEIHRQLLQVAQQQRLPLGSRGREFAAIHRALLTGLLSGVALRTGDSEYTGAGGVKLSLWPGSGLFRERPQWIMAAERLETSRRYARVVARISPTWIEPLAEHLVKRSYSDPHWSKKAGAVMAYEKVSLMGMPVVANRRVPYGKIDPETSRRLFIEGALVDERVNGAEGVLRRNREVRAELAELAAKTRRREYLVDDFSIFLFYDERLPADICDLAGLRRWLRRDTSHHDQLTMTLADLVPEQPPQEKSELFPDHCQIDSLTLPVHYHFSPGSEDDGVTLTVPAAAVQQLSAQRLEWLVPGLLEEKVVALIRALPKQLRKNFVPVPDTAKRLTVDLVFGQGALRETVASRLSAWADERIGADDFDLQKLPVHLQMNVRVVDDEGTVVQMGRDLNALQLASRPKESAAELPSPIGEHPWRRDGITSWDFDALPVEVPLERSGIQIVGFPALVDQGESVALRLLDDKAEAEYQTRRGISRLYCLAHRKSLQTQVRWLPRWDETCVWAASLLDANTLKAQLQLRIAELAFVGRKALPRDPAAFAARLENATERIAVATQELAPRVPQLFEAYHQARLAWEAVTGSRAADAREDIGTQLAALMEPGFLVDVPWNWLQQFPRYLHAIVYRLEKLGSGGPARDAEFAGIVRPYWQRYQQRADENQRRRRHDPELVEFRWMIEELRVSLFAQHLGTAIKISPQRLDKQWSKVAAAM